MDKQVKVRFQLEQDEDDWPPAAVETVWAGPGPCEGQYIIDNAPFFAREATVGDIVQARSEEGNLAFVKTIKESGNSLIRIIVKDSHRLEEFAKHFNSMGCYTEGYPDFKLIAVDIPSDVRLSDVQHYLREQAEAGTLDYEEAILRQDS